MPTFCPGFLHQLASQLQADEMELIPGTALYGPENAPQWWCFGFQMSLLVFYKQKVADR